jgi:hypothetical protein
MIMIWGTKGLYIRPRCIGAARSRTLIQSVKVLPDLHEVPKIKFHESGGRADTCE